MLILFVKCPRMNARFTRFFLLRSSALCLVSIELFPCSTIPDALWTRKDTVATKCGFQQLEENNLSLEAYIEDQMYLKIMKYERKM